MSRKWSEKKYVKGLTSFRDDFFRLLQSGEHTDVTFLVGGGQDYCSSSHIGLKM